MTSSPKIVACREPSEYPDQETRKIVTAGMMLATSFAARAEPDRDEAEAGRVIALNGAMRDAARHDATLEDRHSLGDHLRAIERRLRAAIAPTAGDAPDKPARIVEAFRADIHAMPPAELGDEAGSPDRWWDGRWGHLEDLIQFALVAAEGEYGTLACTGGDIEVRIKFRLRGRPHADDVVATTRFPPGDAPGARAAMVDVDFPRETFDDDQYFSLLAKMHHEVFVHSVQDLDARERRTPHGPTCSFSEGFMDRAAHFSLKNSIERCGLPGYAAEVAYRFLTRGEEQHVGRMSNASPQAAVAEKVAARARIFGRDSFDALAAAKGEGDAGRDWTVRVGMSLNLRTLSRSQRYNFLARVQGLLKGSRADRDIAMGLLSDLIAGGDAAALLADDP